MTVQVGINGPRRPDRPWWVTGIDRLRVWTDRLDAEAPAVRFAASGAPVPGLTLTRAALPAELETPPTERTLFEIQGWPRDQSLRIEWGGEHATVQTPPGPDDELRLLIGSCFYRGSDRGKIGHAYRSIRPAERPHIRIHGGDQLYLDAGKLGGGNALEGTMERYREYWTDSSYSEFLRDGISLFSPDDHDFWNDYPFRMPHLSRSWDAKWEEHATAAKRTLRAFQTLGHPDFRSYFAVDLGSVSLFVMDARSQRGAGGERGERRLMSQDQLNALVQWSSELHVPGLLVSASPLLQHAASKIIGLVTTDHNLLSFEQGEAIWGAVENAAHDMIVLTGDIHQGRLSHWRTQSNGGERQRWEFVASPLSILSWFSGSPDPSLPPTVQVGTQIKRAERTFWGLSRNNRNRSDNASQFGMVRFRRSPAGDAVDVRFELRSGAENIPGRVATSEYAQLADGTVVRGHHDGGRRPCTHEVQLR